MLNSFNFVRFFATPWTVVLQAPLVHGASPGQNTGVGCRALLQGIFPTQGSKLCLLCLLHWQAGSSPLVPPIPATLSSKQCFMSPQIPENRIHLN